MKYKFHLNANYYPYMKAEARAIAKGIQVRKRRKSKKKRIAWYNSQGIGISYTRK